MRERWLAISGLWEAHKTAANKLDLSGRLDFHRELSVQLEWRQDRTGRSVRVVYTQGGEATAALLKDAKSLVESRLYWIACKDTHEAHYLLAIINSETLYQAVVPLMPKGQFGARDLHKHLWKLPIPEFDPAVPLHTAIADAGQAAATGAAEQLVALRATRPKLTVTIARRELRQWLRTSNAGQTVEKTVRRLLGQG